MADPELIRHLEKQALECRIDIISMLAAAGSGHPGGSLSAIDILVTLFFHELRWDPKKPDWEERDRFVLSKGHAVPALYSILKQKGVVSEQELSTLRQTGSRLQGHPDRVKLPFVEASTGSLGKGLSIAQGMALGVKLLKHSARVFCLVGDGESQEGQIWEAAMSAPKFQLNNLVVFIDSNGIQLDGPVEKIMNIRPIADKWRAFGWSVHEINGHDFSAILEALNAARQEKERPTLVVATTVKGNGVSFMEGAVQWHGTAPKPEEAEKALAELRARLKP